MVGAVEAGAVEAVVPYVSPGQSVTLYPSLTASFQPGDERPVVIRNARAIAGLLDLEKNGFVLLNRPTALKDFSDPARIKDVYYPEIDALVKEITGASRVLIFAEIVRSEDEGTPAHRRPGRFAHVDYDEPTVQRWVRGAVGTAEAERLLRHRHVLMNLWRPIATVERSPLAICDASTVEREDLNPLEARTGPDDPNEATIRGFCLQHSPRHRWYYFPRMQPDEILVFKLCDSEPDRVQWTAHTAFDDPTSPADAKPRRSIDLRTISFFEA